MSLWKDDCKTAADVMRLARESAARRKEWARPPAPKVVPQPTVKASSENLESALNGLGARIASLECKIDDLGTEISAAIHADDEPDEATTIRMSDIIREIARYYELSRNDLLSTRRTLRVVRPRQVAMWIAKQHTTRSFPEIGRFMGGRDHTTVLHAVRKIDALLMVDVDVKEAINFLVPLLRSKKGDPVTPRWMSKA